MNRFISCAVLMFGVLCFGMLRPVAVFAQDPLEVGSNVYQLVFENDRVRVMEINFNPRDKISFHSHPDHFVYVLEGGKLTLSYPDGATKDFEGKPGDVVWINAETHGAENVGTTHLRGLVVELKEPKTPTVSAQVPAGEPAVTGPKVIDVPPKGEQY